MQELRTRTSGPEHNLGCGLAAALFGLFFGEFFVVIPLLCLLGYGSWVAGQGSRGKTTYTFISGNSSMQGWLTLLTFICGLLLYRAWESRWWHLNHPRNPQVAGLPMANSSAELARALENPGPRLLIEFESAEERKHKRPSLLGKLLSIPVLLFFANPMADLFMLGRGPRLVVALACLAGPVVLIRKALQPGSGENALDHRQLIDFNCGELYQIDCNSNSAPVLLARFSDLKGIEVQKYEPNPVLCLIHYRVLLLGLEAPVEFGPATVEPRHADQVAERLSQVLKLPYQKDPELEKFLSALQARRR